jgi:hypothetical protein
MLKSAVPIYYFISEKLLPYILKLPSVRATGKKNSNFGTRNTSTAGNTYLPFSV